MKWFDWLDYLLWNIYLSDLNMLNSITWSDIDTSDIIITDMIVLACIDYKLWSMILYCYMLTCVYMYTCVCVDDSIEFAAHSS